MGARGWEPRGCRHSLGTWAWGYVWPTHRWVSVGWVQPAWHCKSQPSPGVSLPMCRECREPDAVCLPWIVERLLEGNSLTFLLLCVSLPGSLWD